MNYNRRKFTRLPLVVNTDIFNENSKQFVATGYLGDISIGGLGIYTATDLKLQNTYLFNFGLPNGIICRAVRGRIMLRRQESGAIYFGIQFMATDILTKWKLLQAIWWLKFHPKFYKKQDMGRSGTPRHDQRRYPRVRTNLAMEITYHKKDKPVMIGKIVDVSEGGLCIECSKPLKTSHPVFLTSFSLSNTADDWEKIYVQCKPVWKMIRQQSYIYGVKFISIGYLRRRKIRHYIINKMAA